MLLLVLPDAVEHRPVVYADLLQQGRQVLEVEMTVWAPVGLAGAGRVLREDLLAAKGRIARAPAVGVAADVAVNVPDVVPVFLVEGVVRDLVEGRAPEQQTLLQREAHTLEEERVLQPPKVFEVRVPPQRPV